MDETTAQAITDSFTFSGNILKGVISYLLERGGKATDIIEMVDFIDRENDRHFKSPQARKMLEREMSHVHSHLRRIEDGQRE